MPNRNVNFNIKDLSKSTYGVLVPESGILFVLFDLVLFDPHLLPASLDQDQTEGRQDQGRRRGQSQSHTQQQVGIDRARVEYFFKVVLRRIERNEKD